MNLCRPQLLDGLASEARQLGVQHELDDVDDVLPVGPHCQVGVDALLHEVPELGGLDLPAHDVDELGRQFHVRLEGQVAAGRALEDEAEV